MLTLTVSQGTVKSEGAVERLKSYTRPIRVMSADANGSDEG